MGGSSSETAGRTLTRRRTPAVTFSVNNNMVTIKILTGTNYKKWKEDFLFAMEMADVHTSLVMDTPADLNDRSSKDDKMIHVAWTKSNRLYLLSLKRTIKEHLKSDFPSDCTAKELLAAMAQRYRVSSNAKIGTFLQELFNMTYNGSGGVRDYIIRMVDYQTKLKVLNVLLPDTCIGHQAMNTLPSEFGIIKINYRSTDESWPINDLISRTVAEEEKLKKDKAHVALVASKSNTQKGKKSKYPTKRDA
ncbi:uncharacterized protein LOC122659417 [Telopea speciosissima]|uniref:uncharacterized protein LOC122659417 n=1 Tax=Telopea speciosissima TaxID=54955 RepID=UPI001CC47A79|nr:uncharacterized protein LOC122659417 [Telopea speciosissima]